MMLGKRKQTTAPWKKGTLKKWPKKEKRSQFVPVHTHAAVGSLNLISQGDQNQSEWAKDHGT